VHSFISGSRFKRSQDEVVDATPVEATNAVAEPEEQKNVVSPVGRDVMISRTLPQSHEPMVIAIPHQAGVPEPVKAVVKVVHSTGALPPASVHVPFTWAKVPPGPPLGHDSRTREKKLGDHSAHTSQAQKVRV